MSGAVYMAPRRFTLWVRLLLLFRLCSGADDEYKVVASFSEPCTGEYSSELGPNERLYAEEEPHHICSPNGLYRFGMDPAGDLSLWRGPDKIWSAGTCCRGTGSFVVMQMSDGNLVVRTFEEESLVPLWSSGATSPNAILTVDDDGQARIQAGDVTAWETNVEDPTPEPTTLLPPKCAAEDERAQECGATNPARAEFCCEGLVCNNRASFKCIVPPTPPPADDPTPAPVAAPIPAPVDAPTPAPVVDPTKAPAADPNPAPVDAAASAPTAPSPSPPATDPVPTAIVSDGTDDEYQYVADFSEPCTGDNPTELGPNTRLYAEEEPHHICSPNGLYRFGMDPAGDLSLWRGPDKIWSAGTCCKGDGSFVAMQKSDGNLVVYTFEEDGSQGGLWSSGATSANAILKVDNDGQARIRAGTDVAWETDAPTVPTVSPMPTATPTDVKPDCSWATGSSPSTGSGKSQPNIILLLTDDQDVVLGSLDNMPILKRVLMERGTNFRNAFVHSPICCPSRMSILSGRYLHNINEGNPVNNSYSGGCDGENWRNDAELETFAIYAQAEGYVTSYAGKYLSGNGAPVQGTPGCPQCFRVPPGYDKWLVQRENAIYYDYRTIRSDDGGENAWMTSHGNDYYKDYFPDLVANRTLAMIEEFTSGVCGAKKPFVAVAAWPTPHGPFTPAPWAENMHDGAKAPRTPNYNASSEDMELKHWIVRKQSPVDKAMSERLNKKHEMRLESLRSVDEHVGMIVDLLEKNGELDNTYIIYTSDNGYQLGQHRLPSDKRHMYENDIRVPFVVSGPGVPRNVETDRPVLNVDIAPTIYELMTGESTPHPNMDGTSFVPYLRSLQEEVENADGGDSTSKIAEPYHREDFLVSYYGEGNPECGLKVQDCSAVPPPTNFHVNDSFNNTYHCVRSLTVGDYQPSSVAASSEKDSVYCKFEDSEQFVEYYDHIDDPWQLRNRANELSDEDRAYFEARLAELRSCQGESCRELPPAGVEASGSDSPSSSSSKPCLSLVVALALASVSSFIVHM